MSLPFLITASELSSVINHVADEVVILDCRADLTDLAAGRQAFESSHIPSAVFADLENDLALPPHWRAPEQGRHPLPNVDDWLATLRRWGISSHTQVVAYDNAGGAMASRAWWMLRWAGVGRAQLLDGGWQAWLAHHPEAVESGPEQDKTPSDLGVSEPLVKTVSTQELQNGLQNPSATARLIDARALPRYRGEAEPIDPVAGHIPGAMCVPFNENLDANGFFLPAEELAQRFAPLADADPLISYCGSGVTAAHNIFAMHLAGITHAKLYVPSWSGWSANTDNPIATGDE